MRYNCQTIAGVVNWAFPVHMLTQDSKLHPEDLKIFMGHGIPPIYVGIHFFCISRKICKCVEGWSVPLSILSQGHEESRSLKCCPLHVQIFPKTQVRCMPTYIGAIPCPMNFFRSSGCNVESWVSICTGNAQFTTLAAPGYCLAIVSHDGIPLCIFQDV
jgi:hypothetical protein